MGSTAVPGGWRAKARRGARGCGTRGQARCARLTGTEAGATSLRLSVLKIGGRGLSARAGKQRRERGDSAQGRLLSVLLQEDRMIRPPAEIRSATRDEMLQAIAAIVRVHHRPTRPIRMAFAVRSPARHALGRR
jgi:hypothetical protein